MSSARRLFAALGAGALLYAGTGGVAAQILTGPEYYVTKSPVTVGGVIQNEGYYFTKNQGTAGTNGVNAIYGPDPSYPADFPFGIPNICLQSFTSGSVGGAASGPSGTVTFSPAAIPLNGTIVAAGSIGGVGGNGGNGDPQNQCGKGVHNGGQGGKGSDVQVTVMSGAGTPAIGYAVASTAIVAFSRGGNGGDGGSVTKASSSFVGGDGGIGGNAGMVTVSNSAALNVAGGLTVMTATGSDGKTYQYVTSIAYGIAAQSGGGQGGEGGDSSNGKAKGGSGVAGGDGSMVSIGNSGRITTVGGIAIAAQSIGGFGGDAGINSKGNGGSGGFGGSGGAVAVINSGVLTVGGAGLKDCVAPNLAACNPIGSYGLYAQSVGGGGGDAGAAAGHHAIGASGGTAGIGGTVSVVNSGGIAVFDSSSIGLYAQSVGGGGGSGGVAFAKGSSAIAIGGSGGGGGSGGVVTVANNGNICTGNACNAGQSLIANNGTAGGANGIFAQSIGGGGGIGGSAKAISTALVFGSSFAVGGSGGEGGSGLPVGVINSGSIATVEINSAGILIQSIGGGGGSGGGALAMDASLFGGSAVATGGSGGKGGNGAVVAVNCNSYSANSIAAIACKGATVVATNPNTLATQSITFAPGILTASDGGAHSITTAGNSSAGIIAQSIGGGGGNGGYAIALAANVVAVQGLSVGGANGGNGAPAGNGDAVYASTNGMNLLTLGSYSPGLIAQSIGGGGGYGGAAIDASLAATGSAVAVGIGGSGGAGGSAGQVTLENAGGLIITSGDYSQGLVAQSIGGGGGAGGASVAVSANYFGGIAVSVAVGGAGGKGNGAGAVTLSNANSTVNAAFGVASITTSGYGASAILAQSIGGGGGSGGSSLAEAILRGNGKSAAVSIGGAGGSGAVSGAVSVTNYGALTTTGGGAAALQAQSIGGGGGSGGFATSKNLSMQAGAAIAIGGGGGGGGEGKAVIVTNKGLITVTARDTGNAPGILAQSVGGAGGAGGFAMAGNFAFEAGGSIAIGGSGGGGGVAAAVAITNSAMISTTGPLSSSIIGQSIGGAGGNGGVAVALAMSSVGAVSYAVGGAGGDGGKSDAVTITNSANLSAAGRLSSAILAQSLGGNGGAGGGAVAGAAAAGAAISLSLGGDGGHGGTAGNVMICGSFSAGVCGASGNLLSTVGPQSPVLVAQSIGGNGGVGGWDIGGSIGGLAGVSVSLGGAGGGGGKSGTVSIVTADFLQTDGLLSPAILAQSIGGSGGTGGFSAALAGSSAVAPATAIGGQGGSGSKADAVLVTQSGGIRTGHALSSGIVAQSIGGNGGTGGSALSGAVSVGNPQSKVSVGAAGASGGNGGSGQDGATVGVTSTGDIWTSGFGSIGLLAQSIGGGGGNGGASTAIAAALSAGDSKSASASVAIGGKGASGGTAAMVTVLQSGVIQAGTAPTQPGILGSSDLAMGILAQSIGGSGGNGGSASSTAISSTVAASVAIGGGGGNGSKGGAVLVCTNSILGSCATAGTDGTAAPMVSTGGITTFGALATAIYAQSIGGGGGNGGSATSSATSNKQALAIAIGGFGGGGGDASGVEVNAGGILTTFGARSNGIFAQSVGGGGGDGGAASASATGEKDALKSLGVSAYTNIVGKKVAGATTSAASKLTSAGPSSDEQEAPDNGVGVSLSIGGAGGLGGNGFAVTVNNAARINLSGAFSNGIFAQSVGGGGGNGGSSSAEARGGNNAASLSLGGGGGAGGDSAAVLVNNLGGITTLGAQAYGIFAQSVGGGGGNGGSASSRASSGGSAAASFALGGSGGGGGTTGTVTVINAAAIASLGANAAGIFAQSVGGGGGNGGSASAASIVGASTNDKANDSTTASTGAPPTSGDEQSDNTKSSASAGDTTSTKKGSEPSQGSEAGADSGYAAGMSIGGSGGLASDGKMVTVTNSGNITTGTVTVPLASVPDSSRPEPPAVNAPAIFAQSIGGGGGNGGSASSNSDAGKASVALSFGGNGAGGGKGGEVAVTSNGSLLTTYAANSVGIFAQSVGGGGGSGGSSSSTSGSGGTASIAMGLGGSGAGGGDGGIVNVCGKMEVVKSVNTCTVALTGGAITTTGANSYGIFAQSVGGGGGVGGSVTTAATAGSPSGDSKGDNKSSGGSDGTSASAATGVAIAAGLGGSGGGGGTGEAVAVWSGTVINTSGANAAAIYAQSVGGGGGAGGSSTNNANSGAYAVSMGLGGSGGTGGKGKDVTVTHAVGGLLQTIGDMAYGIFAQSIGGGGGQAGASNATSAGGGDASVSMAFGGSGGTGQSAGVVTVTSDGLIVTSGVGASAIFAQSVGGGGGVGGSSTTSASDGKINATFAMGGSGGAGAHGGDVKVSYSNALSTLGNQAAAIFAQSVGGGGGSGGSSTASASNSDKEADLPPVALSLGGSGAGGGDGGAVTVTGANVAARTTNGVMLPGSSQLFSVTAAVLTQGIQSAGIFAQSVGGGGGNGGASNSASTSSGQNAASLGLGGGAGTGSKGGTVVVCGVADCRSGLGGGAIVTTGTLSSGIFAQSVGGGGGNGGSAISSAKTGSTDSGVSVTANLGGTGGGGGGGGAVTLRSGIFVNTYGEQSSAIYAQSVGGGGGSGGSSSANADSGAANLALTLGGKGGSGGIGGVVTVTNDGTGMLLTQGLQSYGIFAQSVGGGGGQAGASSATAAAGGTATLALALGAKGGSGGNGSDVKVTNAGLIQTNGANANAVFAQSVGGGGGVGGASASSTSSDSLSANFSLGGAGGAAGLGGAVTVTNSGALTTYGVNAAALFAQSVGGGGGSGGSSISTASNGNKGSTIPAVALALGGAGSSGGDGGIVNALGSGSGTIFTTGANSAGVFAQSVGGGGGNGGASTATSGSSGQNAVALNLGGSGKGGGDGGLVNVCGTVTNNVCGTFLGGAGILTTGALSDGVFAQSVGGGGGNGGSVSTSAKSKGDTGSGIALSGGLGGTAGGGGLGGAVNVLVATAVETRGDQSVALFAQSVGGGGGNGGASTANADSGAFFVDLGLGGTGGSGGDGAGVTVNDTANLLTLGALSHGVLAQSVGGGGGNAGASSGATVGAGNVSVDTVLGASAGSGADGGLVSVILRGALETRGAGAIGAIAQSVGGGGGVFGASQSSVSNGVVQVKLSLGASNSASGNAGSVTMTYGQSAVTGGANAPAVVAQSIGGGGGINSFSNTSTALSTNVTANFALGTLNSANGIAQSVSLNSSSTASAILTKGNNSSGILAQSIGGGGGLASFASSSKATAVPASVSFQLGGNGQQGAGAAGPVNVNVGPTGLAASTSCATSLICTQGANSFGIVAQSIGSGGGFAAFYLAPAGSTGADGTITRGQLGQTSSDEDGNRALASTVSLTSNQTIWTAGSQSVGLLAQAISGGGGVVSAYSADSSRFTGTMRLGQSGGKAEGDGKEPVTVNASGSITTQGTLSFGIVAQSIGGGGGLSLVNASNVTLGLPTRQALGSAVTVTNAAAIKTSGAAAIGIVAQSIAGGGGLAVSTGSATLGGAPSGSNAAPVTVTSNAPIVTSGINAVGILAQSIGGGGGAVISTGNGVTSTFTKGTGDGGTVTVNVNAPITTSGVGAYGVVAQSVGGGGGLVMNGTSFVLKSADGGGKAGLVTVNVKASITTTGNGSNAAFLSAKDDPILNVDAGVSLVGGAGGSAVVFDAPTNELNNSGSLSTVDGANGLTISALSGDTQVNNTGLLTGSVRLAAGGVNLLRNTASGTIQAGTSLDLGGGVLQNDGVLGSAGAGVGTIQINGSLTQSATGSLLVRFDPSGRSDTFHIAGNVQLAGKVLPTPLNPGMVAPGKISLGQFLVSDGQLNTSNFQLGAAPSAILSYTLTSSGSGLSLSALADFSPAGLSSGGAGIGSAIGEIQGHGSSPLFQQLTAALIQLLSASQLDKVYLNIGRAGVSAVPTLSQETGSTAIGMVSGHMDGWRRADSGKTSGLWGQIMASGTGGSGLSTHLYGGTIGFEGELPSLPILVGASAVYMQSSYGFDEPNSTGKGKEYGFDAYAVGRIGQGYVSALVFIGAGDTSFHNTLETLNLNLSGSASFDNVLVGGRLEAGYAFDLPEYGMRLTPFAALQPLQLLQGSASESYNGRGEGVRFADADIMALPLFLGLEFESIWHLESGAAVAPFLKLAWMHDFLPDRHVARGFSMLPGLSFNGSAVATVDDAAVVNLGLSFDLGGSFTLKSSMDMQFSGAYRSIGGSGNLRYSF